MAGDEDKKEEQKEGLSDAVKTQVVRAIGVWMFMFDMGRGNFAHQADQNLALALCGVLVQELLAAVLHELARQPLQLRGRHHVRREQLRVRVGERPRDEPRV